MQRQALAKQAAEWPARLVLEAGDQRIHGKGEAPGHLDVVIAWRPFLAFAADQPACRQWHGTGCTPAIEPGQFGFARAAQWVTVASFIAQQAVLYIN